MATAASKYSDQQKEFVVRLVRDEKCSASQVHELTGIPTATVSTIVAEYGVQAAFKRGQRQDLLARVNRKAHMIYLQQKFAKAVKQLFDK